ncbi:MAG: efflux RND transporter permease subunit [Pseudomonadota bacterium]
MAVNKLSANLMSLGAIDFGIIVDGAVVIIENCARKLHEAQETHGRSLSRQERIDIIGRHPRKCESRCSSGNSLSSLFISRFSR